MAPDHCQCPPLLRLPQTVHRRGFLRRLREDRLERALGGIVVALAQRLETR